jgi:outer membrane receptor protein involved in Fe transport
MNVSRQLSLIGPAALGALCLSSPACAQGLATIDLPPLPLEDALDRFAVQANISLSLPSEGFGHRQSNALRGNFSPEEGLHRLLVGAHFHAEAVGAQAYRIVADQQPISRSRRADVEGEDVVVVSARLTTTADEIPRDVTQLDGHDVDTLGITSDRDLALYVNGMSFTNLGMGRDKIILRGLSDGASTGRAQSLTGIYFNDTRITYGAPDPDLRPTDLRGIEVLKGPQGALYGAGSLGGIVHLQANKVRLDSFEGSLQVAADGTQSGDIGNSVDLVLNQPLIEDVVGIRAVFYDERVGGWLDSAAAGRSNANASHRIGGRMNLLARFDDTWSVELTEVEQETATRDSQYIIAGSSGSDRGVSMLEPHDNDFAMSAITVRGAWDWAELTSSTSLVRHQFTSRFETTGALPDVLPSPGVTQALDGLDNLSILLNETRLNSKADAPIPWFVGLFYADGDNQRSVSVIDAPGSASPVSRYLELRRDLIDELAAFGEVTWPLGDQVSLSTGVRLFRSSLSVRSEIQTSTALGPFDVADKITESGAAPDIRLSYQPWPDVLVYVSAAEGYRGAGVNTGGLIAIPSAGPVQPYRRYGGDEIWTYEFGMRGTWFDGSLEVGGVLFGSDWRNVQSDALFARGFGYTGNAGNARVVGSELDARYRPINDFELNFHLLLNEPELNKPDPSFTAARAGGLPGSTEYSASMSARYDWRMELLGRDADLFAVGSVGYVGPAVVGFGSDQRVGDYFDTDLRVGVGLGSWRALAYVSNVADSDAATFAIGNPYRSAASLLTPQKPRTIGISLRYDF